MGYVDHQEEFLNVYCFYANLHDCCNKLNYLLLSPLCKVICRTQHCHHCGFLF